MRSGCRPARSPSPGSGPSCAPSPGSRGRSLALGPTRAEIGHQRGAAQHGQVRGGQAAGPPGRPRDLGEPDRAAPRPPRSQIREVPDRGQRAVQGHGARPAGPAPVGPRGRPPTPTGPPRRISRPRARCPPPPGHRRGAAEEPQQGDIVDVGGGAGIHAQSVGHRSGQPAGPQRVLHRLARAEIGGQRDRRDQPGQPEPVVIRGRRHGPRYRARSPLPGCPAKEHGEGGSGIEGRHQNAGFREGQSSGQPADVRVPRDGRRPARAVCTRFP